MSKTEKSIEKKLVIQGIIIDGPINYGYGVSDWLSPKYDSKFILELKHDVSATFKRSEPVNLKTGEHLVVKCSKECYIRKGDHVTLVEAYMYKLKHDIATLGDKSIPDSIYVESLMLYNETLEFSFNF